MKRKIMAVFAVLLCTAMLQGCSGFNAIMFKNLSDRAEYRTDYVYITGIYTYNTQSRMYEEYNAADNPEVMYLRADITNGQYPSEGYTYIEVIPDNIIELAKNDFFVNFEPGAIYSVTWSEYIYMDTDFFYVIGVARDNTVYLDDDIGLQNMVDYMNENRSLF